MSTGLTGTNQDLKKKAIEAMFIFNFPRFPLKALTFERLKALR